MKFAGTATALALGALITAASITPSEARSWRPWAAAGAGFAAGAVVGSAMANSAYGYGPGYYSYGYAPGYDAYAAAPGYDAYAAAPGYPSSYSGSYYRPGQYGHYDSGYKSCATDGQYNRTDYSAC